MVDRLSILTMKAERLGQSEYKKELQEIKDALNKLKFNCGMGDLLAEVCNIAIKNNEIWNLEFELKTGKEESLSLEEIGKRAINIRNLNEKRIGAKNRIGELTKTGFKEIKCEHLSATKKIKDTTKKTK